MSWSDRLYSAMGDLTDAVNGLIADPTERRLEWLEEALEDFHAAHQAIADRVESQGWNRHMRGVLRHIDGRHPNSESPIEALLAASLYPSLNERADLSGYSIKQQVKIGQYRVDFLVAPQEAPMFPAVVIECDGKDYHTASETQIERDKIRDRQMQAWGYTVLRFTGREIYADPTMCAAEVLRVVSARVASAAAVRLSAMRLQA